MTLGQARLAILGGASWWPWCVLAEYGAFEILGYQTFTTEIFTEFHTASTPRRPAPCSLVLVAARRGGAGRRGSPRGRGRATRAGRWPHARPSPPPGPGHGVPVLAGFVLLVVLALGVPLGAIVYWLVRAAAHHAPAGARSVVAAWHTALYSGAAALVATGPPCPWPCCRSATPVGAPWPSSAARSSCWPCRAWSSPWPSPTSPSTTPPAFLYQSAPLLIVAYAIMFFPLALVAVRASVARAPVGLEEVGRSLGRGRLRGALAGDPAARGPGPGRRLLPGLPGGGDRADGDPGPHPTGAQTLATQFWATRTTSPTARPPPTPS